MRSNQIGPSETLIFRRGAGDKMSGESAGGKQEVTVVGGGLVGSLLARSLGSQGLRVHLRESRADIRRSAGVGGRSINLALSRRGREALKAVGLEDEVLSEAIPMRARKIHPVCGVLYSIPYGTNSEDCIYSVNRHALNELLLTRAEEHPNISVHFESRLLLADLKNKTLTFRDEGEEKVIKTDFIFGCDGAHSTVRRQMMRWGRLNYQQEYIEHGYKELTMPPTPDGEFAMEPNFLHIWPRQQFMMIALPNQDKSFTLTLFMPFSIFDSITTRDNLLSLFLANFPDTISKIGEQQLYQEYFENPVGSMISVKCTPHYMAGSTLLLGDAAHAVVPFYGQGMNAGFEDCLIFTECLVKCGGDLSTAAQMYQDTHWKDTHAICDLSMYNYIEMRSHVTSRAFLLRKKIDNLLHYLFPSFFVPLYSMVAFTRIPYSRVVERHRLQQLVVRRGLWGLTLSSVVILGYLLFKFSGMEVALRYRILPCVVKCVINDYVH